VDSVKAVVQKVVTDGRHGPYAVATADGIADGSITFSLKRNVWPDKDVPEKGMIVVLSHLRKKQAGWRALSGRPWGLADESTR